MVNKILIIEDDKFLSRAMFDKLERAGFAVTTAYDGIEGIDKIKSENPDLILLDLMMPKKDGFEVLADMKIKDNTIPIIVLSNLGQATDIERAKELGAVDYLVKVSMSINDVVEKAKFRVAKQKPSRS